MAADIFLSGGTGYIGRSLIGELLKRGHAVRSLVRAGSESKLIPDCVAVRGNALDSTSFRLNPGETVIHLTGVSHPSPWKAEQFRKVDLVSLAASVTAAQRDRAGHFIYISVAQPAPVMRVYQRVRAECEHIVADSKLPATILRPWYILGPGHRWPYALLPLYKVLETIPGKRAGALRLGLVTLPQMVRALVFAVENPPSSRRIMEVPDIRSIPESAC